MKSTCIRCNIFGHKMKPFKKTDYDKSIYRCIRCGFIENNLINRLADLSTAFDINTEQVKRFLFDTESIVKEMARYSDEMKEIINEIRSKR